MNLEFSPFNDIPIPVTQHLQYCVLCEYISITVESGLCSRVYKGLLQKRNSHLKFNFVTVPGVPSGQVGNCPCSLSSGLVVPSL